MTEYIKNKYFKIINNNDKTKVLDIINNEALIINQAHNGMHQNWYYNTKTNQFINLLNKKVLEIHNDKLIISEQTNNQSQKWENTSTLKILNKSQQDHYYEIEVEGLTNFTFIGKQEVHIKAGESYSLPLSLAIDPYDLSQSVTEFNFVLFMKETPDIRIAQPSNFFKGR